MNLKRLIPAILFLALNAHARPLASFMGPGAPAPENVIVKREGDQQVKLEDDIGHAFVLAGYKYPEPVVVEAIRAADQFLVSLGWLRGDPSLTISNPPAWPDRKP